MAKVSLDFHVLSALWMLKVGCQYDRNLTASSYGNRLRRGEDGEINPLSLGSFKPYLKPFRDWRDNGIQSMRTALEDNKKIVAVTADVSSFYHELNPGFMLKDEFNCLFDLELTEEDAKLHRLFITALQAWADKTPLRKGLPVGLLASAVVANMALIELDRLMEKQVAPLYYGRYVDDFLLVMENGAGFNSTEELWEWLFARSDGLLDWNDTDREAVKFKPAYLHDSQVLFANSKNKVFLLSGEQGKRLVESIAWQIHQRASEWRALPNLPMDARQIGTDLVTAVQKDGEAADNLRETGALIMRRAGFAIKLRDFEAYERDLPPETWQAHRHAFFCAFIRHVLVLPHFFDLSTYLPRVIQLATACEDFDHLRRILNALDDLYVAVDKHRAATIKSCPRASHLASSDILNLWGIQLFESVRENIIAAFPTRLSRDGKAGWQQYIAKFCPRDVESLPNWPIFNLSELKKAHQRLFLFDLAHMPFRFIGLPKEMIAQRGLVAKKYVTIMDAPGEVLPENLIEGISILAGWTRLKGLPHGLLFSTRPFNLTELTVLVKDPYSRSSQNEMQTVVPALRGFSLNDAMPHWDKSHVLQIPNEEPHSRYSVAVTSWKTENKSWVASVMRKPDPDLTRYARLNRLLNSVISQPKGAEYCILPELSLPARWFMRMAKRMQHRGISLIAGIEYLHARRKSVRNQVWAALSHDGQGFASLIIYRQDKQHPALHEELELKRLAGLELKPEKRWTAPPVIQHGDFRFALLVCSELTNISYRAALRGDIDALFVPEWNQDTRSFNALVESSALDIHAYIIQCNDRQYGDSRIRAPYKDDWMRDLLRVKGGINDYCVTGRIDVRSLRQFQSSHRSPEKPYKPVPDGFEINHNRKLLPEGE